MSLLESIILGVVEGLTEFLPVSSTGHLILVSHALSIPETEFLKSFEIAIQLGAICAVVALYWKKFLDFGVLKRIAAAFLPTAIIGFSLYPVLKNYLLGSEEIVVVTLFLGGIALILFDMLHKEKLDGPEARNITYTQAFTVGVCQSVAIIPGVSRSAATILGGLLLGMNRVAIVEFSFLLAAPTLAAATGFDLIRSYNSFSLPNLWVMGVGFLTAFIVAMMVIKLFLKYIKTNNFALFGIYRIVIAITFGLALLV